MIMSQLVVYLRSSEDDRIRITGKKEDQTVKFLLCKAVIRWLAVM
jgi:hypothetical protein